MTIMTTKNWIQSVMGKKGKKGAPRGEGTLRAQAKQHGKTVAEFAKDVERCPDNYKKITKQRVGLYRTLQKTSK